MAKKSLKILLTSHHRGIYSGSTRQLYLLAQELVRRGHQVKALFRTERGKQDDPSLQRLRDIGVEVFTVDLVRIKTRNMFRWAPIISSIRQVRKILLQEKFDLVNTHSGTDLDYLLLSSIGIDLPVLIAYRGMAVPLDPLNFIKYHFPRINRIIVISQAIKKIMIKSGLVREDKFKVIYGGVDLNRFRPGIDPGPIQKEFNLPQSVPVVIFIGSFVPRPNHTKGGYWLMKAMEQVLSKIPQVKLLVVGGADKNLFYRLASPQLQQATIFTGFREDVPELISASNLLVNCSLSEGLAGVIREALACAKPVVATAVGGNPELALNGETGILVPPKDPEALAQAIIKLLTNPELSRKFGEKGRELVEKLCSNERRVDQFEEVYFQEYEKWLRSRRKRN